MKVLLVDDEDEFRDLLGKRLVRRGLEVAEASGGEQAVRLAADGDFDVVVLDVKMPGMDGLEALRRIKQAAPSTEVLLLTGHASTEAAVAGMDLGAFDYLIKPVSLNDLLIMLQDACQRRRLARG